MQQEYTDKIIKKREKKKGFEFVLNNEEYYLNDNIQFNFGSIDDKKFPKSIYINSTFWFELKKDKIVEDFDTDASFNRYFRKSINDIFKKLILPKINENNSWINKDDTIFYFDIPNNIFYSDKRCFCSLELTLYTNNYKGDNTEFDFNIENNLCKSIFDIIHTISSSSFFSECLYYSIHKRKK
jgi:hypothetical protein